MTPDQRDQLLDLHRAAMEAHSRYIAGGIGRETAERLRELIAADDAFRAYLFALPVSSHT